MILSISLTSSHIHTSNVYQRTYTLTQNHAQIPELKDSADTKHFGEMFLSLPPRDTPKAKERTISMEKASSPSSPLLLPSSAAELEQPFKRFSFTGPPTPFDDGTDRKSVIDKGSIEEEGLKKVLFED